MFKLALRELHFAGPKLRSVLFLLVIGMVGPLFASSLRSSVSAYLSESSKKILSADLAVSATRPFKPEEVEEIRKILKPQRSVAETEFVTMARGKDVATLVEVKGVDPGFPLVGAFVLKAAPGESTPRTPQNADALSEGKIAWAYPEVLAQLGLKEGEDVTIGKARFTIQGVIEEAPGLARTAGFAPRVFIGKRFIEDTGLIQFGSQVFHRVYVELPPGLPVETAAAQIKTALPDPDIFLRTPDDAIRGFDRFFSFFNLYLSSITMVIFVLSWIAAFYILQIFLQDRLRNAAIFLVNGASRSRTAALYAIEILLLMLISYLIALVFVAIIVALAPYAFSDVLPEGFRLRVGPNDALTLFGVALFSGLAFVTPFWVRLFSLRLQTLLAESSMGASERLRRGQILMAYAPLVIVFLGLSIWLMDSVVSALRLAGGMAATGVIGLLAGRALFRAFFATVRLTPGFVRLIATRLARSRFGVNLCFLSLVLVALAMNLVPHLLSSVVREVQPLQGKEIPSFFLFNIPESQVESLKSFSEKRGIELRYLSPLILARLSQVDGKAVEKEFFQKFPVRVSFREERIPSERIVAGRDLPGRFDPETQKMPEISMEQNFAERHGFEIGQVLTFDVQGIPIEGRITSLRKVNWTSFNPNFFMMFQPGVLDDAPKTYIANVNLEGGEKVKVQTQFELIRDFPDMSVIDIGRTIERVLEVARSVIGPVRAAAGAAVAMSFLILIGVIVHNLKLRDAEIDIEKLLGADAPLIRRLIVGEYAATALFAWLVGTAAAAGLAWAVTTQVLEIDFVVSGWAFAGSFVAVLAVTVTIAYVSATRVLNLRGASRKL